MKRRLIIAGAIVVVLGVAAALVLPGLLYTRCIVEGTSVDTPSGPRAIESLNPGDDVMTSAGAGRVVAVHTAWSLRHLVIRLDGHELRATAAHPISTPSGWREAGALREGDVVRTIDGSRRIDSVSAAWSLSRVFDLEVEPTPDFFASGVLVHNKSSPQRSASVSLKTLATAQADFRSNDRDEDRLQNFWVADVRGLYSIVPKSGEPEIKLIEPSIAMADSAPRPGAGGTTYAPPPFEASPKSSYHFRALTHYVDENGRRTAYDEGNGRCFGRYGFIAHPVNPKFESFIMCETITIWRKQLNGAVIDTFPRDPAAEGWTKLD